MSDPDLIEAFKEAVLHGEFNLASGEQSSYFIEAQRALLTYPGFEATGKLVAAFCEAMGITAIGGPATGAISVVCAALAQLPNLRGSNLRGFYLDEHGVLSGQVTPDDIVMMVDDVMTTGESLQWAIDTLRDDEGIDTFYAIAVVNRADRDVKLTVPHYCLVQQKDILETPR